MTRCGRCRQCECAGASTTTSHGDARNRDNDAPDAVLEGLAMAGLVDILRQLGDLAELAAEVFDDMQDQVMAASARGRRLAARARKLLAADLDLVLDLDLPPPSTQEHRCLSSAAAATALATSGGAGRLGCRSYLGGAPPMPRVVVQRIERCRGPPRLSLLDKFDAAGDGACLKRYTDPSFFFRAHSAKIDEQGTLKQHRRQAEAAAAAGAAGSMFLLMQQTAAHRVEQPNMEQKLQEGSTAQPSPSELERTSSFEAWLSPQARRFPTATAATTHHHLQEPPDDDDGGGGGGATTCSGSISSQVDTTSNAAAVSSSSTVKAVRLNSASLVKGGESNTTRSRYKGKIASRVSSLPRKLFMNTTKHHNDHSRSFRAGSSSLRVTQATDIGDCSPELEAIAVAIPTPDADRCSNSNSSTPETCTAADSKNLLLLLPGSGPVLEPPDNSSAAAAEDAKVHTPLAPIPPMQWLSEKGTPPASPKHRTPCFQQQFGSSGQSDEKPSQEHEASDHSSNLLQESVFFSAAQELAKMSPPPPWVPRPKYPLLDVKALRNGPSPIHPSRNILDSRSAQIKDIAISSKLKPASRASSHVTGTGSPTNATILNRADGIRQRTAEAQRFQTQDFKISSDRTSMDVHLSVIFLSGLVKLEVFLFNFE
uniref:Protein SCAR n=1 Tax=Zea mays TaxID=4577 RepID=A0A804QI95_MAIZE